MFLILLWVLMSIPLLSKPFHVNQRFVNSHIGGRKNDPIWDPPKFRYPVEALSDSRTDDSRFRAKHFTLDTGQDRQISQYIICYWKEMYNNAFLIINF